MFHRILEACRRRGGAFLPLIDQERIAPAEAAAWAAELEEAGADGLLVGSSFTLGDHLDEVVAALKKGTSLPVLLFPGNAHHVSRYADGILFLSLLSGRNPLYLVEEQVRSAPLVREAMIEPVPTAYLLVGADAGRTVHFVSGTSPIPPGRPEIAMAHALAAQYMGMKLVYLEAGSGASSAVPPELIRRVRGYVTLPIAVGGGIRTARDASAAREAGADLVVVGDALEKNRAAGLAKELAAAIHADGATGEISSER